MFVCSHKWLSFCFIFICIFVHSHKRLSLLWWVKYTTFTCSNRSAILWAWVPRKGYQSPPCECRLFLTAVMLSMVAMEPLFSPGSNMWDDQSHASWYLVITKGHNIQGLNAHTVASTPITNVDIVPWPVYLCYLKQLRVSQISHVIWLLLVSTMPCLGMVFNQVLHRVSSDQAHNNFGWTLYAFSCALVLLYLMYKLLYILCVCKQKTL